MATITLSTNQNDRIICPLRGEISVEWCLGCPRRVSVDYLGHQTVIVCDPGIAPERYRDPHGAAAGWLQDVPEIDGI
jgi:hypothetical protein